MDHSTPPDSSPPIPDLGPAVPMGSSSGSGSGVESYNPWSVVNLVFHHLAAQGLHPVLGSAGYPGAPAAELLRCLGIQPAAEGNRQVVDGVRQQLADIRAAMLDEA
jgi:hypothetical protein